MVSLATLISMVCPAAAWEFDTFGAVEDVFGPIGPCGGINANILDDGLDNGDHSPPCMRPVPIANPTGNKVACNLRFDFVDGTLVVGPPPVFTVTNTYNNVVSVYEDACRGIRQNLVYLTVDTTNLTPPFDPALTYALQIRGLDTDDLGCFSKLTNLFSIYLTNLASLPPPITIVADAPTQSLFIVFGPGTDFNELIILIAWNAAAQKVNTVFNPILVPIPAFEISITSELITGVNHTFTGVLLPEAAGSESQQKFFNYDDYPSRTFLELAMGYQGLQALSNVPEVSKSDYFALCGITGLSEALRCVLKSCRRYCCPEPLPENRFRRYCALICGTLCCLKADKSLCCVERLEKACKCSQDPVACYTCCVGWLANLSSSFSANLFTPVCGPNPYCKGSEAAGPCYGFSGPDCKVVDNCCMSGALTICAEGEVCIEMAPICPCDESSSSSEENLKSFKSGGSQGRAGKKSFIARFKWHIVVSVAVMVSGGAAAYALTM